MDMHEAIKSFPKQFLFEPEIKNGPLKKFSKFVLVGMGGSHLAVDLIQSMDPLKNILIHEDYGLPQLSEKGMKERLVILSSYSGNTEEVIDAFQAALKKKLNMAVMSVGGKLIELAKEHDIPYVKLPDMGIQPRLALGLSTKALLALMGEDGELKRVSKLAESLKPEDFEEKGKNLAEKLQGYVPVIYSSNENKAIAYNWKIKFNETGKIPAFYNVFPELNHNEMTGFDSNEKTRNLSEEFYFIFLSDKADDKRIQKRMEITKKLYQHRGLPVEEVSIEGEGPFYKIFSSLLLADWVAYHTAKLYGAEPNDVPMVEEFKKLIEN